MEFKNVMKSDLVRSAASLVLCGALFTGGTLAYFTKTVTSEGNTITTGRLDIADLNDHLFNVTNLKPGDEVVKTVKIENTGNLAFNYVLKMVEEANNQVLEGYSTELQKAIIVSVNDTKIGTLRQVLDGTEYELGTLEPNASADVEIKLEMPEKLVSDNKTQVDYEADTYSGKTVGNFSIVVTANETVAEVK